MLKLHSNKSHVLFISNILSATNHYAQNYKDRNKMDKSYNFISSSISSFFWHPVVGLAMLNCSTKVSTFVNMNSMIKGDKSIKILINARVYVGSDLHLQSIILDKQRALKLFVGKGEIG